MWKPRCRQGDNNPGTNAALIGPRDAFTLVEVVVACVIFAVGVLALQGAATVVLRQSQDARNQAMASEVAAARFEAFSHITCVEPTAGAETVRGVRSEWHTTALPNAGAGLSSQTIHFGRPNSRRSDTHLGAFRCR